MAVAVQSLLDRGFSLSDVQSARKDFESRAQNPLIEKALRDENAPYSSGNPANQKILKQNSEAIAACIRAGAKK